MVAAAHEILHCTRLLAPCRRFGAASELLRLRQVLIDGTIVMAAATHWRQRRRSRYRSCGRSLCAFDFRPRKPIATRTHYWRRCIPLAAPRRRPLVLGDSLGARATCFACVCCVVHHPWFESTSHVSVHIVCDVSTELLSCFKVTDVEVVLREEVSVNILNKVRCHHEKERR